MAQEILINLQTFYLETCYTCKVPFAMDRATHETAMRGREKFQFCCPFGHTQHYVTGENEATKLRRERDRPAQKVAERDDAVRDERQRREHAERSASAYKGKVTRLKNRAAAGLCPCCNRSFQNLHKHMTTQHPEFKKEDAA